MPPAVASETSLPDPVALEAASCSVQRTLEVIGERWTLLVLRGCFYGVRRFADFQRRLDIARDVLSVRLRRLVARGILVRVPYREEGRRERCEYRLTPAGRDLYPVLVALMQWGDRHLERPPGPTVALRHKEGACGAAVRVELVCAHGHRLSGPREVVVGLVHADVVATAEGRPATGPGG